MSDAAPPFAAIKAAIRAELATDGATQADLARYLGVSQKHVSGVLTGRQPGSPRFIEAMAAAVGLTIGAAP
jgi:transcriptional regulator with XRE-family HTH domain